MAHSQIPLAVRRAGSRGGARAGRAEDPQLRRMLATHVHCGEPMQLVAAPGEGPAAKNDGGLLTYRCACGFSFDHWEG
ncbi:hypothetical protein LJR013_000906 [Pseudarthrobacter oxydans]|jgi:hypothetical protein|uniref:Uncharacterized protein n=1 Tax=Pseudarthrobacter oxydans TaxID=1671 RepID=A0AAW8N799_PSEOX|nr:MULTISPECIES: hypothetical protein [Pseudarthrobacter]MBA4103830.1 hypothetical protein [Arthrobacter sp.]MDV2976834.1 hypothetical protein [Actinomycetes bacterium ARC8]MDR6790916.1 hypothetical protein [Pseudarthrobacter oxydans]MDR7162656.1 hypothetical protein [Pseudarthrobacter oxydans]NSX36808.1 hypothetical protein [Pseudarthrobacter oxydans]